MLYERLLKNITVFLVPLLCALCLSGCTGAKDDGSGSIKEAAENTGLSGGMQEAAGGTGVGSAAKEAEGGTAFESAAGEAAGNAGGSGDAAGDGIFYEAVWLAYWDDEDYIAKLSEAGYNTDIICMFEAYFDGAGRIVTEDSVIEQYEAVKSRPEAADKKFYLSFVNDVVENGVSSQKDTEVLYKVLSDPEGHAEDIVNTAKEHGFDGIEIDYEKIRGDLTLWALFTAFEEQLIIKADQAGLGLRVILEPSTPVESILLPAGPEYVVMCYNLYGYGTKPGAKADREFLYELCERFKPLYGNIGFAFANGGFDWNLSRDSITALSDAKGRELIEAYKAVPERDTDSKALHFTYEDGKEKHEVYYADDETLRFWKSVVEEKYGGNARISLWKI